MYVAAQVRKSLRFSDCSTHDVDQIANGSLGNRSREVRELVLHRTSVGYVAVEICQSVDDAGDYRGEKRLFTGKVRIDRRLARRRHLGDFVNARALEAFFEKELLGSVEDPPFHVGGETLRRSAGADAQAFFASCCWPLSAPRCNHDLEISEPPSSETLLDTSSKGVQVK